MQPQHNDTFRNLSPETYNCEIYPNGDGLSIKDNIEVKDRAYNTIPKIFRSISQRN